MAMETRVLTAELIAPREFRLAEREIDDPGPGEVQVRVNAVGLCGSDLHFLHGKAPIEPGEIMGHQATGVVVATGRSVELFSTPDRVVVSCDAACGLSFAQEARQTRTSQLRCDMALAYQKPDAAATSSSSPKYHGSFKRAGWWSGWRS